MVSVDATYKLNGNGFPLMMEALARGARPLAGPRSTPAVVDLPKHRYTLVWHSVDPVVREMGWADGTTSADSARDSAEDTWLDYAEDSWLWDPQWSPWYEDAIGGSIPTREYRV